MAVTSPSHLRINRGGATSVAHKRWPSWRSGKAPWAEPSWRVRTWWVRPSSAERTVHTVSAQKWYQVPLPSLRAQHAACARRKSGVYNRLLDAADTSVPRSRSGRRGLGSALRGRPVGTCRMPALDLLVQGRSPWEHVGLACRVEDCLRATGGRRPRVSTRGTRGVWPDPRPCQGAGLNQSIM